MKPVIVITVYRRYHELVANLEASRKLFSEFSEKPSIVVVWACPELRRLWLFQELLRDGKIDHLLTRQPLQGEGTETATTFPESHNIRLGLEFVKSTYGENCFAVVQAADIKPNPEKVYKYFDSHMSRERGGAVVFHWDNPCINSGVWHTNCFAVSMNEKYWPPVVTYGYGDTLESAWGKGLAAAGLPAILRHHNYSQKRFVHAHVSEKLAPFTSFNCKANTSFNLFISGRRPWWRKLLGVFSFRTIRGLFTWPRFH